MVEYLRPVGILTSNSPPPTLSRPTSALGQSRDNSQDGHVTKIKIQDNEKEADSKSLRGKVRIFWEGHKVWKNLPLRIWHYSVTSSFKWKMFSNFVAFSKYSNFNYITLTQIILVSKGIVICTISQSSDKNPVGFCPIFCLKITLLLYSCIDFSSWNDSALLVQRTKWNLIFYL